MVGLRTRSHSNLDVLLKGIDLPIRVVQLKNKDRGFEVSIYEEEGLYN